MQLARSDLLAAGRKRHALFGPVAPVAVGLLTVLACPLESRAQANLEPGIHNYLSSEQLEPSREDWRQRVEAAKRLAKEVSRKRRENPQVYLPAPEEDPEMVATERVLHDDSLRHGDIVVTKDGMFVFKGRDDQPRKVEDFVRMDPSVLR